MKNTFYSRSAFRYLRTLTGVALCCAGVALASLAFHNASAQTRSTDQSKRGGDDANVAARGVYQGVLVPSNFDESPPLSQMFIEPGPGKLRPNEDREVAPITMRFVPEYDPAVQSSVSDTEIPGPIRSFDAQSNISNVSPPDPNGDVGPNHIVTMSNLHFQIFNKTGASVFGPAATNTLWAGFGGPCQTENAGDPVALYDPISDRWFLSQFTSAGPSYFFCVAISTTPDPTGTYYRYAISTGSRFPDYPKAGVWPDAYYVSTREFTGSTFNGVGAYALNRQQAVAGNPSAAIIAFLAPPSPSYTVGDGLLPSDLDGPNQPPAGSPNYFIGTQDNGGPYAAPSDAINLWKFTADFSNPGASSFVLTNTIPVAAFDSTLAICSGRACIPQPATTHRLDHLGYRQRPLFRLAYRNFGTHESLVTNQSVDAGVGGPNNEAIAGIRWWEIRNPGGTPVIHQEGTFAPGLTDGIHRWMGAAAMNSAGSIALAYSAANDANPALFPSIRYTGRYPDSPLGTMPAGEGSIIEGTGSLTSGNRWGDYTSLSVDPVDDDTFWHVNEYVPTTSTSGWRLRVGSFKLATTAVSSIIKGGAAVVSAGPNNTIDPGETVTVTLGIRNLNVGAPGTACTSTTLTGTLQPGGGVTAPSGPQNYGSICTEGPTTYRQFTFTVDPSVSCNSTITATLQVDDGLVNFGTIQFQFVTGSVGPTTVIPVENFDGVASPALPAGWTPTSSGSGTLPTTVTTFPDTAPNALFFSAASTQGLSEATSPAINLGSGENRLNFRLEHNTQLNRDGLLLEISVNGGAFQDIEAAGGVFESSGYTGTLLTSTTQLFPGRRAWSGLSGGTAAAPLYKSVTVKLPPSAAGQNVQFKWRQATDGTTTPTTNPGSRIDTITLANTLLFCGGNAAPIANAAASRKVHGAAGTFDIPLNLSAPLTGPISIEPRSGPVSGEYQIVVAFPNAVTVRGVTVNAGNANATHSVAGDFVTINLTNVSDVQRLGLTLTSVNDGANIGSVPINVGILGGDVNGSNSVTSSDVGATKAAAASGVVDQNTFRADVVTNGTVNTSDVGSTKSKTGSMLP